jgi:hypothetical protein
MCKFIPPVDLSLLKKYSKEWFTAYQINCDAVVEDDKEAKEKGDLLGRCFWLVVGDGRVPYRVMKVNENTVHLEIPNGAHLELEVEDHYFGNGGVFPKSRVMGYLPL